MKKIYTLIAFLFISFYSIAQSTSVTVEIHQVHCGSCTDALLGGEVDLTGFVTYRVYVNLPGATDCLSSIIGGLNDGLELDCLNADDTDNLLIDFEGQVFNHDFGSGIGAEMNCGLFSFGCTQEWDSWVTIGASCLSDGAAMFQAEAADCSTPSLFCLGNPDPSAGAWFDGCDFFYDNGGWFSPNGLNPAAVAGTDLKVLIAQFTTNGGFSMSGWLGYQAGCEAGTTLILEQFDIYQPGPESGEVLPIESVEVVDPCNGLAEVLILNNTESEITYQLVDSSNDEVVDEVTSSVDVTISIPAAGTYYVIADDGQSCLPSASEDFTVDFPEALSFDAESLAELLCSYSEDGAIETSCAGGVPAYEVELHYLGPGEEFFYCGSCGDFFADLACGSYVLTMTDGNGCQEQEAVLIECVEALEFFEEVSIDASCFEQCDGSYAGSVDGGTGQVELAVNGEWVQTDDPPLFFELVNLCGSLYTLSATDENGCYASAEFYIDQPQAMYVELAVILEDSGNEDGSIDLQIEGGTPPYVIQWSNGETGISISDLGGGNYTATITDDSGCSIEITYEVPVGIAEMNASGFALYPNPARDFVTIESATPIYAMRIIDGRGRVVSDHQLSNGATHLRLDVSAFAQGYYSVTIATSAGPSVLEFLRE